MKKLIIFLLFTSFSVSAAPVRFDFVFDDPNSTARSTGYIVFEENLLANPGNNNFSLPNPAVLDLQLTVTGSIDTDGSYDLSDYIRVYFETNGGTLDFSQPLIGQATNGNPWGTTLDGNSGDFNLLANSGPSKKYSASSAETQGVPIDGPPSGCDWFTLCEYLGSGGPQDNSSGTDGIQFGTVSPMELQSMQRGGGNPARAVPTLSNLMLLLLLAVVFGFSFMRLRKNSAV